MEYVSSLPWLVLALIIAIPLIISLLKTMKSTTRKPLPPGPFRLPIFGNLFMLGPKPHKSLAKLSKTYGPLMALRLGSVTTVVVSSVSMAKEVLLKNDLAFSGRFPVDAASALGHVEVSVIWMPVTPLWRSLRKICNSHVFSISRLDASEDLRSRKVEDLLSFVEKCSKEGKTIDIGEVAFVTSLNLLSNTFFSIDFAQLGSDRSQEYKNIIWKIVTEFGKPNFADYFPVLKGLDLQGIRHNLEILTGNLMNVFDELIEKRLDARKSQLAVGNDALDALLNILDEKRSFKDRTFHIYYWICLKQEQKQPRGLSNGRWQNYFTAQTN